MPHRAGCSAASSTSERGAPCSAAGTRGILPAEVTMRALAFLVAVLLVVGVASAEDDPLLEGRDLLRTKEKERGVTLLREVIAESAADPKDGDKQRRAGRAHHYLDEDAEAVAALERARRLEPAEPLNAFWLGRVAMGVDDAKALLAFRDMVALAPKDPDGWYGLGLARKRTEDLPGAIEAWDKALELDASYDDANYEVARVLEKLGRVDEASARLRRELVIDPEDVDAGVLLSHLEHVAGRHEDALKVLLSIEPHAGGSLDVRSRIVVALFALGRHADAAPWREKIRALHAASTNPKVRQQKDFRIDDFTVGTKRVVAYEMFDRSSEALVWFAFHVYEDGKHLLQVNLEPGPVAPALGIMGGNFYLGAYDDVGHMTYDKEWASEPPYLELRAAAEAAIRGEIKVNSAMKRRKKPPADAPK